MYHVYRGFCTNVCESMELAEAQVFRHDPLWQSVYLWSLILLPCRLRPVVLTPLVTACVSQFYVFIQDWVFDCQACRKLQCFFLGGMSLVSAWPGRPLIGCLWHMIPSCCRKERATPQTRSEGPLLLPGATTAAAACNLSPSSLQQRPITGQLHELLLRGAVRHIKTLHTWKHCRG